MLSEKIKRETAAAHQELEKKLIRQVKEIRTAAQYEYLLRLLFGYYHGLEERIARAIDPEKLEDYPARRKAELIRNDLSVFSTEPPYFVPVHIELPEVNTHLQAMGALYALESLTPDGKIIIKMLRDQLGLSNRGGLLFFRGYAQETWQKLEYFTRKLNTAALSVADENEVIAAAVEAFAFFNGWFDKFEQHATVNRTASS